MPPLVLDVLRHIVAPALLAAAFVLAVSIRFFGAKGAGVGAVAAFLMGCVAANHFGGAPLPWLPVRFGWHWLLWVAAFAMLIGLAARGPGVPTLAGWLLRALAAGHAAWLLAPAGMQTESIWVVPALGFIVFIEWGILELLANKLPGGSLPLAAAVTFLTAAAVLIHAHTASMTEVATFSAAALSGIAIVAWWTEADIGAAMPAVAVMLPGLLLSGHYETSDYSKIPWQAFALVGLAPMALIISLAPPLLRLHPLVSRAILIGLLVLPCAVALAMAMQAETVSFE